ncbi:hypothetical protein COL30_05365 [Bacillus pseudomycoides]|uniref:hypothetical protein n=1 Tax=Bacillus pseudomycoides TaxID=64104 RepID=UPI000BEDFBD6|nr:hypothetical protein [Bacillus pseudomycoides]PEA80279.1 hypothetical protein CON99_29240 [Bacillus pseudomycoides]PEK26284.1 hypothetical protein CN693_09555 [Bacillus pseudomycoides]PEO14192.1 hypothetical protein CN542_18655 [Bacillus pseudomycoides]PEP60659.1 hypothetical protein CN591_19400 [Bacillus pseudomycoides]PFW67459.1 hypothetical protein COL25_16220 [Bacillus pseudomycoides]
MILLKVIAYILLSIGAISFIAAGGTALLRGNKGHILLVKMNLIIAAFYLPAGSLLYLCTLREGQSVVLQAFLIFSVGIAIIHFRSNWYLPQRYANSEQIEEQNIFKDDL